MITEFDKEFDAHLERTLEENKQRINITFMHLDRKDYYDIYLREINQLKVEGNVVFIGTYGEPWEL